MNVLRVEAALHINILSQRGSWDVWKERGRPKKRNGPKKLNIMHTKKPKEAAGISESTSQRRIPLQTRLEMTEISICLLRS